MAHSLTDQVGIPADVFIVGPVVIGSVKLRDEVTTDEARVLPDGTVLAIADANGLLQGVYDGITPGGLLLVRQATTFGSAFSTLQSLGGVTVTTTTAGPIEALDVHMPLGAVVTQAEIPVGASVAPLGIAGTITLGPVPTAGLGRIVVAAFADVDGSFDVEESFDGGATFHPTGSTTAVVGGLASTIVRFVTGSNIRIVYTNGAVGQATFQIRAVLRAIT